MAAVLNLIWKKAPRIFFEITTANSRQQSDCLFGHPPRERISRVAELVDVPEFDSERHDSNEMRNPSRDMQE